MSSGDVTPLWVPSAARADSTRLAAFRRAAGKDAYEPLHEWSVSEPEQFWRLVWDDCGMLGEPGDRTVEPGDHFWSTRFFPDGRLSVVENLLAMRSGVDPGDDALVAVDETGARVTRSWDELRAEAAAAAAALRAAGVRAGDRVAAWLPNQVEAVVAMLGAAAIGAVFSSTSPDFGARGVLDRFGQIEPVVLVAADGYRYGGKRFDCLDRLAEIRAGLPALRATVVVGETPDGAVSWDDFLAPHRGASFTPVVQPFDHPWYILYSSGTTGIPKCIVHRAGGVLLQHLKEHQLHCDIRARDRVLYFTTTGWMMWNWLASTLASGATAILYDGSPFHPGAEVLFDLADAERITLLGVSAKFIDSVGKAGIEPARTHDLGALRTVCSTGSPLSPLGFHTVYERVKADVHLASISGGTDLCGCLVGGDPTGPVYAGELQRPVLGMATDVADDAGRSLGGAPGMPGELVCRQPFPSMPLGFWRDDSGQRYHEAYFARFPEVWAHGDFASWTEHGGMVILGRSDATLNPGGVRIGTAEIYRVVDAMPEVVESLAFGQEWHGDVRTVLLVRLADGRTLDDDLVAEIRARVRAECSPRHVPAVVAQVDDLPRTRSNKLVELAVADAVHGRPVRNTEAIANPETIDAIVALPALREEHA
ncbi:MAG TPA: acetoacetate--CoA ligase [Acidimicrobiia bacterium]|nr:acetoacetate--CoA ligase [Acidimicrobiia bacterium]